MKVIVGLGNPGKKYENTRHNMGFIALDLLAEKHGIKVDRLKFKSLVGEGRIADQRVLLVKPQTYMNLSGEAVREALAYYKVQPEDLIVIYDDIDIPTGTIRLRKKGSAGTHNGMKNVIYQIQSDDFPRIRVGIGSNGNIDLIDYVTGGVTKEEKKLLEEALVKAAEGAEAIVLRGIEKAMNEYNIRAPKEKKKDESDD